MSLGALGWAIKQKTGSATRKAVLMTLADCHNDEFDLCCPSFEYIAEFAEVSVRTAKSVIKELASEELNLIRIVRRGGDGSGRNSNAYIFNMSRQQSLFSPRERRKQPVDNSGLSATEGGLSADSALRGKVQSQHQLSATDDRLSATSAPEPVSKPGINQEEGKPDASPPVDNFASGSTDRWLQWIRHLSLNRLKAHQHEATRQAFVSLTEDQQKRCLDYSMGGNASGKLYPRLYPDRFRNDADLKTQGHKPSNPGRESNVTAQRLRQKAKDGDPQAIQALEQMGMAL